MATKKASKTTKSAAKTAASSSGAKLKFGSPAWRAKYGTGKKKASKSGK